MKLCFESSMKKLLFKYLVFIFFVVFIMLIKIDKSFSLNRVSLINKNTYAVIVGVLKWQSRGLTTYSPKKRKDLELYKLLLSKGMKKENSVLLLDSKAALKNIKANILKLLAKSNSRSTFIFYYAGHGIKKKQSFYLANYDYTVNNKFDPMYISKIVRKHFKGNKVFLFADCCYSGMLKKTAKSISKIGKSAVAITSAGDTNVSTNNWTFTQGLIDVIKGNGLADKNNDGKITLKEAGAEISNLMKYLEKQKSGYFTYNISDETLISNVYKVIKRNNVNGYKTGDFVLGKYYGVYKPCRIIGYSRGFFKCVYYRYNYKFIAKLTVNYLKKIKYKIYRLGLLVNVMWQRKKYLAKILKIKNSFHYITYPGWPTYWNEWVLSNRIYPVKQSNVYVKWKGKYYPAKILKKKNNKYFIHYIGYSDSWNEWVTKNRVLFIR